MTDKERLELIIMQARDELDAINRSERAAENRLLVGKCYAYRNSYSCATVEEDYWTQYVRVVGVSDDGELETLVFETDKYGEVRVRRDTARGLVSGHTEIPHAELNRAWDKLRNETLFLFGVDLGAELKAEGR